MLDWGRGGGYIVEMPWILCVAVLKLTEGLIPLSFFVFEMG